jgi:hypothetical protein
MKRGVRHGGPVQVAGRHRVIATGQQLGEGVDVRRVRRAEGTYGHRAGAEPVHLAQGDDVRAQLAGDGADQRLVAGAGTVDLVDEDHRGDAEPTKGAHQHPGLGLDPFHGGDDEHGAVEHVEHAFDLGDEVRVTRRVDQVDENLPDPEETTADLMVMPRARSRARVSVCVLPWSTLPIWSMTPAL